MKAPGASPAVSFPGGLAVWNRSALAAMGRLGAAVRATDVPIDRSAAFERLVVPHRALMARAVWRVTRDPDLAEEALQEALAKLWRKLPVLSHHPNPRALILRFSVQAGYDQLRSRTRRERRWAPLEGATAVATVPLASTAENGIRLREVVDAVARLKRRQATALLLRVVHEESYEVIATTLGCSESTARVHVLRAREKLRRWLGIRREEGEREERP